jgi:hypothetical protein
MSARCRILASYHGSYFWCPTGLNGGHYHGIGHGPIVLTTGVRMCDHRHTTEATARACTERGK